MKQLGKVELQKFTAIIDTQENFDAVMQTVRLITCLLYRLYSQLFIFFTCLSYLRISGIRRWFTAFVLRGPQNY